MGQGRRADQAGAAADETGEVSLSGVHRVRIQERQAGRGGSKEMSRLCQGCFGVIAWGDPSHMMRLGIAAAITLSLSVAVLQGQSPAGAPQPSAPQQAPPGAPALSANGYQGLSLGLLPAPDPAAVDRGKQIFTSRCAFCHGANATGGESGPDLVRSVVVLHDEGKGTAIGP